MITGGITTEAIDVTTPGKTKEERGAITGGTTTEIISAITGGTTTETIKCDYRWGNYRMRVTCIYHSHIFSTFLI